VPLVYTIFEHSASSARIALNQATLSLLRSRMLIHLLFSFQLELACVVEFIGHKVLQPPSSWSPGAGSCNSWSTQGCGGGRGPRQRLPEPHPGGGRHLPRLPRLRGAVPTPLASWLARTPSPTHLCSVTWSHGCFDLDVRSGDWKGIPASGSRLQVPTFLVSTRETQAGSRWCFKPGLWASGAEHNRCLGAAPAVSSVSDFDDRVVACD